MNKYKDYFDNLFKNVDDSIILDEEQRNAIISEAKNQIIIAGAGAGKTTTMVGKVKFLVDIKKVLPEEILLISFTNKAVNELKERIHLDFKINSKITTFHKLGYEIVKESIAEKLTIISDQNKIVRKILKKYHSNYFTLTFCDYFKYSIPKKIIYIVITKFMPLRLCSNKEEYQKFIEFSTVLINKFKIQKINNGRLIKQEKKYYNYIVNLHKNYQEYLKNNNLIDFEDMIIEAKNIIENHHDKLPYRHIIIDEYQDISQNRFDLAKQIAKNNNANITVVGDDWQAIFGFAGADIELFTKFNSAIGEAKMYKITNTYRNSQELIEIVGKFIMKNKAQIKKTLISKKHISNPIILVKFKDNQKTKKLVNIIANIINEFGQEKTILILGRYNFDIFQFIDNHLLKKENEKIIYNKSKETKIIFLTIHASKGLGFDNVILLNNYNGIYGFPSQVKDNSIFKIFHQKIANNDYEEERRLFYVALTRTKNKVFLLIPERNYSIFIKELIEEKNILLNEVNI